MSTSSNGTSSSGGWHSVRVKSYSGHTYAERPESFTWQGAEHQVDRIEKEWREPAKKCFRVRTTENKTFQLCYNETMKEWSIRDLNP